MEIRTRRGTLRAQRVGLHVLIAAAAALLLVPATGAASAPCRQITHMKGKTCVPAAPKRIVTLGGYFTTDNALALGLKPLGAMGQQGKDPFGGLAWIAKKKFRGVEYVGDGSAWNLEKILALRPDLIVAGGYDNGVYHQLSTIAPTVVVATDFMSWRKELLAVGNVLNRRKQAMAYIRAHDRKAKSHRRAVARTLKGRTVTVMRFQPNGTARGFTRNSYTGSPWYDLRVKLAPGLSTPEAIKAGTVNLGIEELPRLDADIIFAVTGTLSPDPKLQETSKQVAAQFKSNPLWQTLRAVKTGNVYSLPRWVTGGGGALFATATLDVAAKQVRHQLGR